MEQLKHNLVNIDRSRRKDVEQPSTAADSPNFWQDLEHFIRNTNRALLVLLVVVLLLLAFLVAGFVLATVVLLVTFYFFICEQSHIESLEYS